MPSLGKALSYQQEEDSEQDPYAVAVIRQGISVGHVLPGKISVACSFFLHRGGTINYIDALLPGDFRNAGRI